MTRTSRASTPIMVAVTGLALGLAGAILHALAATGESGRLEQNRALVEALDLTDLTLFGAARYTRHLSQADLHSAFQDGPMLFEHFPSGSLVSPPVTYPASGFADKESD